ncbi:MAG: hypothetical protein WCD18_24430 [Thermosynechococcaceae cyanobacterium]
MSRSGSGALRNPTVLAMLGSAGIHVVLVAMSALSPADSQQGNQLRIVNLAPGTLLPKPSGIPGMPGMPGTTLPVPNGLPPLNLGNVPDLGPLPDVSAFRAPLSQSFYTGSGTKSPAFSLGNLPISNIPQASIPTTKLPNSGRFGLPNNTDNGTVPLRPPTLSPFTGFPSSGASGVTPNNSNYGVAQNPNLPQLNPGGFQNNDLANLYAKSSPVPPPNPTFPTGPSLPSDAPTNSTEPLVESSDWGISPQVRGNFKNWLQAQSDRRGQTLSAQAGPRLTATYPPGACASKQEGSAVISAVYGPDGSLANGADSVQILQSATSMTLNRAAISAVEAYRPPAAGIYQAFNFTVDIPYSATVCQPPKSSETEKSSKPKPKSKAKPTPSPSASPEPRQGATPKPPSAQDLQPAPSQTLPLPSANPSPFDSPSPSPTPQSVVPSPKPQLSESQELAPLPSPEIAVPESTPKP